MAETCIVCLGDLRTSAPDEPPLDATATASPSHHGSTAKKSTKSNVKSIESDDEAIAHLLPCKHDLHNSCLKPWVERANSCPICRAVFNMVELSEVVGGPVVDSYPVRDKVQEAELDPTMIVEDELFAVEAWETCMVCGGTDEVHEHMYCDGCDKAIHVFCAGLNDAPEVWYCQTCLVDLESDIGLPGLASAVARPRRRAPPGQRRARRANDAIWARVWQEVSQRLDLDLDFPFDEEYADQRTEEQRREFTRWQRRFEVASQQGASNRLRDIASARLQQRDSTQAQPESQEVLRAWNAFDKARESQDAPASIRKRKRKLTASPGPSDIEPTEEPVQKRPLLRRPRMPSEQHGETSTAAAQRTDDQPTFLSSLLHEVETKPISAGSPGAENYNGHYSPGDSSPSPPSSGSATPRALSVTPPPQRPLSPPLSSTIVPLSSPIVPTFSPFSPAEARQDTEYVSFHRGRRRRPSHDAISPPQSDEEAPKDRASSASPSRGLSYSAKEEIQRMVKVSLRARYQNKEITKEQYTDINRDVSRKLYELVGSAAALEDRVGREKWQHTADEEVKKAIAALAVATISND